MPLFLRLIRWQVMIAVLAIVAGWIYGGSEAAFAVAILAIFEVSLSFDNAIVNAEVMREMAEFWKKMFLIIGVPIAAIGMRLFFPIAIVAVTAGLSLGSVTEMAFNDPAQYQHHLESAAIAINTLGGTFLALVFLGFFFDPGENQRHWIGRLERTMGKVRRPLVSSIALVTIIVLLLSLLVPHSERGGMYLSAGCAIGIFVLSTGAESVLSNFSRMAKHAGLATFIYLEILDASFSFDGVIGAFAISNDVVVIFLGLSVGALFVRTLTLYFDRAGTLTTFVYLSNGAHWAVGVLAAILLARNVIEVPELFTAVVGVGVIGVALASSIRFQRRDVQTLEAKGES